EVIYCLASLYSLLVTLGICTNAMIITATIMSKALHGTCNILIAFCAFSDILHLYGHLPKLFPIFAGQPEMSSLLCCFLQIIPNFGMSSGTILVLLIALDRFIAVRFATFAVRTSVRRHLAAHLLSLLAYAGLQYSFVVIFFTETRVICNPPEAYHGAGKDWWALTSLIVYLSAIAVYIAVWREMRKVGTTSDARRLRRISRAIFSITAVVTCGWLLTMTIVIGNGFLLDLKGRAMYIGNELAGIPVNISLSVNYFVLYFTSSDYRAAFRRNLSVIPIIGR
ncbi:hypothetical protein PFISCL1PPCAC_13409, partial [Pristionchus fissidentatus]